MHEGSPLHGGSEQTGRRVWDGDAAARNRLEPGMFGPEARGRINQAGFQGKWLLLDTWATGTCLLQALPGRKSHSELPSTGTTHVQLNPEPNIPPILQISGFHLPGLSHPTLETRQPRAEDFEPESGRFCPWLQYFSPNIQKLLKFFVNPTHLRKADEV